MRTTQTSKSSRGFSIIEIMVGLAIGLISMLIVMQVFATFEGQKRTTTSGANAETNGGLGLYTMERDLRMAGYGLNAAVGCTLQTSQAMPEPFNPTLLTPPQPNLLLPVRIDNGGGLPDTITLLTSDKPDSSVPINYWPIPPNGPLAYDPNNVIGVKSYLGIAAGDMMVIYQTNPNGVAGSYCTLFQVNGQDTTASQYPITHNAGIWDQAITGVPGPLTYGMPVATTAQLMDLGSFVGRSYSLDAAGNLKLTSYCATASLGYSVCPTGDNNTSTQIIASDIVNLQAQYGFDTRANQGTSFIVDTWSNTMIDADASGTAGDVGDIRRIYAVRIAIVARSGLKEKPQANGVCNITTAFPIWASDAANPTGIAIDISKNPDGSANPDWQCYRYKTFETVVPLRNQIW